MEHARGGEVGRGRRVQSAEAEVGLCGLGQLLLRRITKEATAKLVSAIHAQAMDEDAAILKVMDAYERAPGDTALAFKLSAEERDRRKKHNLCFNEECSGQFEHDFREREKCKDPARRALASKQPRQTGFRPSFLRRPGSPASSRASSVEGASRASSADGASEEDTTALDGEDSDAFDPGGL